MFALPPIAAIELVGLRGAASDPKQTFSVAQKVQIKLTDWTNCTFVLRLKGNNDKASPAERRGRKATGPRFLREAMEDLPKDPRAAKITHKKSWLNVVSE